MSSNTASQTKACASWEACFAVSFTDSVNSNMVIPHERATAERPATAIKRTLVDGDDVRVRVAPDYARRQRYSTAEPHNFATKTPRCKRDVDQRGVYRMPCTACGTGYAPRADPTLFPSLFHTSNVAVQRRAAFGASVATVCWATCEAQGLIFTSLGPIVRSATSVS